MTLEITKNIVLEGLILPFDKPYGWTSFDMVNKIRKNLSKFTGIKKLKVGHAGTLDPLATGLLILGTGAATKKMLNIQEMSKWYEAEITLGATTPSFDLETAIDHTYPTNHVTTELLHETFCKLTGKINQIPPLFSAKKFDGKRAYEYARNGIGKRLKASAVEIYSIELIQFSNPIVKLRLNCSKGTYIRAFARDLGILLKSGAYLSNLRRTAIGEYSISSAWDLEKFQRKLNIL
jgi:tRNA pseudouridine55 synthase